MSIFSDVISYLFGLRRDFPSDDNTGELEIYGPETRLLRKVFGVHSGGTDKLCHGDIGPALEDIQLYPSSSQVSEMVRCARGTSDVETLGHVTFGEFCVLSTDLSHQYKFRPSPPMPKSQKRDTKLIHEGRAKRAGSSLAHFQVFLGGSCNPTTWRRDVAIPFLKSHDITFYNPQVTNWSPELIELEDQAKQVADLLFFVIDNQTRATASRVEVAYLVGCGRQIIVVLKDYEGPGIIVNGDKISLSEFRHLQQCQSVLIDLLERVSVPVFHSTQEALECMPSCLKQGVKVQELGSGHRRHPVKYGHLTVGIELLRLRNLFRSVDSSNSGKLDIHDVCLAYRCCMMDTLDSHWLAKVKGSDKATFSFEEFCCLVTEKRRSQHSSLLKSIFHSLVNGVRWLLGLSSEWDVSHVSETETKDVFLGGSFKGSNWRERTAIPLLRKQGLTYVCPQTQDEVWSAHLAPSEAALRENCRLMLYVVGDTTRACASLIEAGYYVGQGCNMVLCILSLQDGVLIDEEKLTPQAVKDYNRSRIYLSDIANREGVTLFDNVTEAVECVVQKMKLLNAKELQS